MAFRASVARLARASVKMREMPLPSAQEFNPPVAKNAVLGAVLFGLVGGVYYMTVHRMQEQDAVAAIEEEMAQLEKFSTSPMEAAAEAAKANKQ